MYDGLSAVLVALVAFFAGAVPFSNMAARHWAGVDLRTVGTGTVSGTGLYRVAGFAPLVVAGIADVAKGAVGPALATGRPALQAVCCGLAVVGHDWSPFLRGAGGRGIAPALGALLVTAWPGTVVLGAGLGFGRLAHHSALGTFVALVALVPVVALTHGAAGAAAAAAVVAVMVTKRLLGNAPPPAHTRDVLVSRLLFDRDPDAGTA